MLETELWMEWGDKKGRPIPTFALQATKRTKPTHYRWAARTPDGTIRGEWIKAKTK